MSKSRGNIVRATPIQQVMGIDALRYFLLREVTFGQDGNFSYDALVGRYNSDLANGLGNLVSRTLTMITQYRKGVLPPGPGNANVAELAREAIDAVKEGYDNLEFSRALEAVWTLLSAVDKLIVEHAPWKLAKSAEAADQAKLDETLYTAAETVRLASLLLSPCCPSRPRRSGSNWDSRRGSSAYRARSAGVGPASCRADAWQN